jgi:hypothetical protein
MTSIQNTAKGKQEDPRPLRASGKDDLYSSDIFGAARERPQYFSSAIAVILQLLSYCVCGGP